MFWKKYIIWWHLHKNVTFFYYFFIKLVLSVMILYFYPINKVRDIVKGGEIMRIGSINQVSQMYQTTAATKKKDVSAVNQRDALSISSFGKDYQIAKNALANVPDVRQEKVDALKKSISDGTYEVNSEDFAAHLIAALQNRT